MKSREEKRREERWMAGKWVHMYVCMYIVPLVAPLG